MSYKMSQILAPDGNPVAVTDGNRDGSRTIQIGDFLYSFGGWKSDAIIDGKPVSTSLNDVYRSSGDLSLWERLPNAPWPARHTFGLEKLSDKIYVFGNDGNNPSFDCWITYDAITWYKLDVPIELMANRVLYGSCSDGAYIYIIGGYDDINMFRSLRHDVWRFDGNDWERMSNGIPAFERNLSGAACCYNGKIYVISGGYYHKGGTKEMYSSVDFGANWILENPLPFSGRQYHSTIVFDGKLWILCGTDNTDNGFNGNLSEIWTMEELPRGLLRWSQFSTPPEFKPRHAAAVSVYNDKLTIACGNYWNNLFEISKE